MSILHYFFHWVGRLTGTIVIIPHPITIGNCGEDIYYGLMKARREGKKLVIFFPYELPWHLRIRIPNREMSKLESPYRVFLPSNPLYVLCCVFISLFFGFFRGISIVTERYFKYRLRESYIIPMLGQELLWKPKAVTGHFSWDVVQAYEWDKQAERWLEIAIAQQSQSIAERQRKEMGLPANAWFVCLHVREGGYHNDRALTDERNADIDNYLPAIQEITRRGGWVVRMGDTTMKRLPPMDRVIDYPFSAQKNELMDVYLLKECHTYVGMQSGILDVATMFQRPTILTNMYSWFLGYPQKETDLGILKHVYSKSRQRFLSPMEWPLIPWAYQAFDPREDFVFYENSAAELVELVTEYFDRSPGWAPSAPQLAFNELRLRMAKELLGKPLSDKGPPEDDIYARYRLAARLMTAKGMLGAVFLQSNSVPPEAIAAVNSDIASVASSGK